MTKGSHNEPREFEAREEEAQSPVSGENGRASFGSGTCRRKCRVPPRKHCPSTAFSLSQVYEAQHRDPRIKTLAQRHRPSDRQRENRASHRNSQARGDQSTRATCERNGGQAINQEYDLGLYTIRPNQGNGGHTPNSVHHSGRAELMKRRARARQKAEELRRKQ